MIYGISFAFTTLGWIAIVHVITKKTTSIPIQQDSDVNFLSGHSYVITHLKVCTLWYGREVNQSLP